MWGIFLTLASLIFSLNYLNINIVSNNLTNVISSIGANLIINSCFFIDDEAYINKDKLKENLSIYFKNNITKFVNEYKVELTYYDINKNKTYLENIKGVNIILKANLNYFLYMRGITYYLENGSI